MFFFYFCQFLEQMSEMVLKGIEAAQHDIEKDSEEKLMEEVIHYHGGNLIP